MSKQNLGQFYSTNVDRILDGMQVPEGSVVIEPFAGNMDLVKWSKLDNVEMYDITPLHECIIHRDTLMDPPEYTGKFVLTNPPYRNRVHNPDKKIYDKYSTADLFHAFLYSMYKADGGIVILPLSFFTGHSKTFTRTRDYFMSSFKIIRVNYFEVPVFDDTTTTIVSFQFERNDSLINFQDIEWNIYDATNKITRTFTHKKSDGWLVGGYMFNLPTHPNIKIMRHRPGSATNNFVSNLILKTIDYRTSLINLQYNDDPSYKQKISPCAYLTFEFDREFTSEQQKEIANSFNIFLTEKRNMYQSLFLSMYREKARRCMCVSLAIRILSHVLLIHPEIYVE